MTTIDRISRALNQRLFLIDSETDEIYYVQGSTGSEYRVYSKLDIENRLLRYSCECMDFKIRRNICKHVIFILMRVMQVDYNILQDYFKISQHELNNLHQYRDRSNITRRIIVKDKVKRRDIDENTDECPICFELLLDNNKKVKDKLIWCEHGCGNSIHERCFTAWSIALTKQGKKVTCVLCRNNWS